MASSAAPPAGGLPLADITSRMAVFSRLFLEDVGLPDPSSIPAARDLVSVVRSRVPRSTLPGDESPIFEAAAFVGEWIRARADARWVAEGPYEPHVQVLDGSRGIVYLVPLVSVLRVATTAGYDGLAGIIENILDDVGPASDRTRGGRLRVQPGADAPRVEAWLRENMGAREATRAALWRRCQTCARTLEAELDLPTDGRTWEAHAATAAAILAARPSGCACGGVPGEVSRFLMTHGGGEDAKFADIFVGGSFTRVACWRLASDGAVEPYDATLLAIEDIA